MTAFLMPMYLWNSQGHFKLYERGQLNSCCISHAVWQTLLILEQGKMEKTGCKIICGTPTTLAVKGLMMMMNMNLSQKCYIAGHKCRYKGICFTCFPHWAVLQMLFVCWPGPATLSCKTRSGLVVTAVLPARPHPCHSQWGFSFFLSLFSFVSDRCRACLW